MKTNIILAFAALGLSACATSNYKARNAPPPQAVTVAVKQFTTRNYASLPATDRGVRDYEHVYYQAELIQALNRTPGVEKAFVTASDTPAADLAVEGVINYSNGRDIDYDLIVKRADGVELARKHYLVSVAGGRNVAGVSGENAKILNSAAYFVAGVRNKLKLDRDELRALVYARAPGVPATEDLTKMGKEAAMVERNQLLAPLTAALVPAVSATSGMYYQWQLESIPVVTQKQQAEAAKASAETDEALGMILGMAGAFGSGYAAGTGNTAAASSFQNATSNAMDIVSTADAQARVAENRVNQLGAVLASYKSRFNVGAAREVTVRIYNRVITLKGSKEAMTAEFRQVVAEEMQKELAKAAASKVEAKKKEKTLAAS